MIVTEIYNGQGLGNQLFCYIATRVLALKNGYEFGIMNPFKFKCLDFLELDFGNDVIGGSGPEGGPPNKLPNGIDNYYIEKCTRLPNGDDIRLDDLNLLNIKDNTKIDGIFQSESLIYPYKDYIKNWLKIKKDKNDISYSNKDICIINFRGGEYVHHPNVFLNKNYWNNAISVMKNINKNFEFVVVTDDVNTAKYFFPEFKITHLGIWSDYSIIKNAHYLIASNSSFAYFPFLTNEVIQYAIAPKYWSRHNTSDGYWSCGYNIYRNFNYLDRNSNLFTYEECVKEFEEYKIKNSNLWN